MSFVPADTPTDEDLTDDPESKTDLQDPVDEPRIDDAQERERDAVLEKTVTLAWLLEGDDADFDSELPLLRAIEANSQRIAEVPSRSDLEEIEQIVEANSQVMETRSSESDLEGVKRTVRELSDTVTALQEENRELRESINRFEDWSDRIIDHVSDISADVQLLLTVSDLAVEGVCPDCNAAPLQVKQPLLGTNRIECANEDCNHVAELELTY